MCHNVNLNQRERTKPILVRVWWCVCVCVKGKLHVKGAWMVQKVQKAKEILLQEMMDEGGRT